MCQVRYDEAEGSEKYYQEFPFYDFNERRGQQTRGESGKAAVIFGEDYSVKQAESEFHSLMNMNGYAT